MQSKTSRLAKPSLLAAILIATLVLVVGAAKPGKAFGSEVMAYSLDNSGNRTNYYSTDAALTAGYSGKTVYLDCDWYFTGTLQIADSKTITIDMNGHKITTNGKATVILLNEHANLTLKSSQNKTFSYSGFDENGKDAAQSIETGGLVCEGGSSDEVGGIRMNNESTLTLDNVAVCGNQGVECGGIYMKKKCTLNINNGASVTNNKGKSGGVLVYQENSTINMSAGLVNKNYTTENNYTTEYAAGITSSDDYTTIKMNNYSSVCDNYGSGIEFRYTYFTLTSDDNKTSTVKDNAALLHGAGIYVEAKCNAKNEGKIENITISGNKTTDKSSDGGGIYLSQRYTRVTNCDIVNNTAGKDGGGISIDGSNCSITDCTITGNKAGALQTNGRGGGVYVGYYNDVYLSGTCLIRGNSDNDGEDDLALQKHVGSVDHQAYIKGGVDDGSSIGIYLKEDKGGTAKAGDTYPSTAGTKIGIDVTNYTYGTYFTNRQGLCITHGSDNTLWVSSGSEGYLAKVNGVGNKRYQTGTKIVANGKSSDSNKHFWYWSTDTSKTTGLSPITDYITEANKYDEALEYLMPNNDTNLQAEYVDYVKSGVLIYEKPEVGKELPKTGEFMRTDGAGIKMRVAVELTWYSVDENNESTAVTGVAKAGKKYRAVAKVQAIKAIGQYFDSSILTPEKVTILTDSTGTGGEAACFTRSNESDSSIEIWSETYEMPKPTIESVEPITINVRSGYTKKQVEEVLPTFATVKLSDGTEYMINTEIQTSGPEVFAWPEGMLDDSGKVTAPATGSSQTFSTTVKLADKEGKVASVDGKLLNITIVVTNEEIPLTPELSPYPTEYTGTSLKVTATCRTEDATIFYSVDGEEAKEYDASTGIVLTGKENESTTHKVKTWSQRNGEGSIVQSDPVEATYTLNDTAGKEITVKCSDTGLVAEGQSAWSSSFIVTGTVGETIAIVAPAQDGRVFDHWEWDGAPEGTDLTPSTLAVAEYSTSYTNQIKAVYTPVISTVNLEADAPIAHSALAKAAKSVNISVGNDEEATDISSYLSSTALSWSPSGNDDGNATHNTTYAAMLSLNAGSPSESVKYLLSDDVKLLVNGYDVNGGAYIIGNPDGTKSLKVDFPSTGPYEYKELENVTDGKLDATVEISYATALSYQNAQDQSEQGQGDSTSWGLPSEVNAKFQCGESKYIAVTWKVSGFSVNATGEQTITAVGTVKYTDEIDNEGAPETITATIKVGAPEKVEATTASVESGSYATPQYVALSCATEGATIYYTTDGTEPTQASEKYDGQPIKISGDTTLKMCAFKDGMKASEVATYTYSIEYQQVAAPMAKPDSGVYTDTQQVTLSCDTEGATIYYATYTTDAEKEQLAIDKKYKGEPIEVAETTTVVAYAAKEEMTNSKTVSFAYNIECLQTAMPKASVASGTYKQNQSVELSCDTEGSTIRYTTDGSDPTEESAEYGGPIQVTTGTTVKARAYRSGMAPSDVATFEYSIERTVTFDTGDGSAVESQTIADGCTVQRPADPTRKGLQFKGWADAEGDAYDFDSPVTSDLTLYAQWTDAAGVPMTDLVVTFDSAGGSAVDSQYVPRGETAQKPVDPTNGGFKFDGWYLEDGTAYDFSAPVTGDLTLRAQWSGSDAQPTVAYEVTFDTAGGSAVASQTIAEGGTVTKPTDPTQEGFTFDGWTLEDGNPYDFDSPVTSSFTLYASWTASDEPAVFAHVVTFDSAGGTAVADQVVGDGGTVKRPEDPTQEGWTFGGWYLENGDLYDFASAVTGDLTLYAHWSTGGEPVSACLVTFDSSPGSEVTAQTVRVGGTVKKPADPVFAGFKFDGWYLEGGTTAYDFSSPVTSSLTLYAKWSASSEPAYSFQVTFDAGEGIAIDAQTVAAGGTVTRPADPVKEGSTFAGWLTENGTLYDFDSPVNSSFTLYAKWAASGGSVPAHVVTFDSAGGTAVADQVVGDGETVRKPDNPTQEGFAFDCWVDENGTTAYDFSSPVTTDLTLYAVWSVSSEPVFAHIVIFDSDGGSVVNSQTVGDGGTATRPADPVREGYTFAGWFLEDGAAYDFALPVSGDVKLVAKWEKNPVAPSEEDDGSGAMAPVDSDAPGSDEDAALEGGEPDGMPSATPETGDGASTAVAAVAALASLCAILVARSARQRRRS